MSTVAIVLMWGWLAVAFAVVTRWRMGAVSDARQKYWAKYESR